MKYYKIITEFDCFGKPMVTVKVGKSVHVMDYDEWQKIYGRNHQGKWQAKVDWIRFDPVKGYKKFK